MASAKMLTLIRSPRWPINALASSRKRSSEVISFRECAVEEELQGIRCVDLPLGERLVRDVSVVGDQEWRPVPRATVLLARNVGQSAAVGSAGRVHDRQALRIRVRRHAEHEAGTHHRARFDAPDEASRPLAAILDTLQYAAENW